MLQGGVAQFSLVNMVNPSNNRDFINFIPIQSTVHPIVACSQEDTWLSLSVEDFEKKGSGTCQEAMVQHLQLRRELERQQIGKRSEISSNLNS